MIIAVFEKRGADDPDGVIIAVGATLVILVIIILIIALYCLFTKTSVLKRFQSRVSPESNLEMEKRKQRERKEKQQAKSGMECQYFSTLDMNLEVLSLDHVVH